jgi:hypothetical protein
MRPPKVGPTDHIELLIATPRLFSATNAARAQPDPPAHDAFTRLLARLEPDPDTLWAEARSQVGTSDGDLIVDDSTLDTPYARSTELVTRPWPSKHKAVARGINLVTLLWTDGDRQIPCDYRIDDTPDGRTKNHHFTDMIWSAYACDFKPRRVVFDGWYSSLENLKMARSPRWMCLTQLKSNRLVYKVWTGTRALKDTVVAAAGTEVWLPGFGLVKVFAIATPDGGAAYWATNDLGMTHLTRVQFGDCSRAVEHYSWSVKQCTRIERCHCRSTRTHRNQIGLSLRAFLWLEVHCFSRGICWVEARAAIIRDAVRADLTRPRFRLNSRRRQS